MPQPAPEPLPCEALESCHKETSAPKLEELGAGSSVASGSGNTARSEVLGSKAEETKKVVVVKPLTRAQKYAKAVKACKKVKNKKKRAACLKTAKKKYGPVSKKARKSSRRPAHHTAGARGR